MPEEQQQDLQRVDVRDYLKVLWQGKFIIVITTILVVTGAFFWSYVQPNEYEASTELFVEPRSTGGLLGGGGGEGSATISNEIILLGAEKMRTRVRDALGRTPSVSFANVPPESNVIRITSTGKDPEIVAEDANTYAEEYLAERRESTVATLEAQMAGVTAEINDLNARLQLLDPASDAARQLSSELTAALTQQAAFSRALANPSPPIGAEQIKSAGVPTSPESPKPVKTALAALGIGLVLGIALAFLREYLDDTIKTKDDVERASGLTVVGMIPQLTDWKDRAAPRLAARESPTGPTAEAYRTLRTSIQFLGLERTIRTLLVTSPAAGEGKSTTAANLAITFAHAGQRVVLLSSDFRRPRVHTFFGLSNQIGFTSVLLGETAFSEALQTVPDEPYVTVLPSGPRPPNPSELLNSRRAAEAIAALAGRFDLVLIDSPPVLPVSDSLVIAGLADAILVVARAGQTRKKGLHRSIELLRQVEAPLVGAVLNGADSGTDYGYGTEYHPEEMFTQKPRKLKAAPPEMIAGNGEPVNGKRRWLSRSKSEVPAPEE